MGRARILPPAWVVTMQIATSSMISHTRSRSVSLIVRAPRNVASGLAPMPARARRQPAKGPPGSVRSPTFGTSQGDDLVARLARHEAGNAGAHDGRGLRPDARA